jgi:hypothetical protein
MKRGCLWGFGVIGFFFIVIIIWGTAIDKVCVAGNPDYEKGTGFCSGNGRKDDALRKKQEILEKKKEAIEKKKKEAEEASAKRTQEDKSTFGAIHYICKETIKNNLREPSSFEEIDKTFYGSASGGTKKGVIIKYRAKNGFGGMNIASAGCLTETGKAEDIKLTGTTEN